jgi:hypothetical protein
MAFDADPSRSEPLSGAPSTERLEGGAREHRLIREGSERLAHGAMICPSCSLPVALEAAVSVGARLACGFCEAVAPARDYLVRDVYDTAANEVYLVARIG